ncbi:MAG: hypothetical protein GY821_14870 [Gammaproteobacteria bacterium]|nr:hypothetical protein [Gammaproteobacteria bacterium]
MGKQLEDAIDTLSANVAFSAYYLSVTNKMGWMSGGFKYNSNPPCPTRFKNTLNKIISRVLDNMGSDRELNYNEEQEITLFFDNLRDSDILNLSAGHIHTGKIDPAILTKISTAISRLTNKLLNNHDGEEGEFDKKFYLMAQRIGLINANGEISKLAPYQTKVCYERAIQELFTKGNLTGNLARV